MCKPRNFDRPYDVSRDVARANVDALRIGPIHEVLLTEARS